MFFTLKVSSKPGCPLRPVRSAVRNRTPVCWSSTTSSALKSICSCPIAATSISPSFATMKLRKEGCRTPKRREHQHTTCSRLYARPQYQWSISARATFPQCGRVAGAVAFLHLTVDGQRQIDFGAGNHRQPGHVVLLVFTEEHVAGSAPIRRHLRLSATSTRPPRSRRGPVAVVIPGVEVRTDRYLAGSGEPENASASAV